MIVRELNAEQKIYIVYMHQGSTEQPEIIERFVSKVGRKYITDDHGCRYCAPCDISNYLQEDSCYGEKGLLFATYEDAKEYIEKVEITRWISVFHCWSVDHYSLEDLRNVKAILTKGEK